MATTKKIFSLSIAFLAFIAISLQFYITDFSAISFFSFFTTLANSLIALAFFSAACFPNSMLGKFFSRITVLTALILYLFIVGLVYNTVLRGIWQLQGIEFILDNIVHVAVPLLSFLYWLIFLRRAERMKWADALIWLVFPFFYLLYTLLRGHYINWYPYPFLNAQKLGYSTVLLNILMMLLAFLIMGFLFIFLSRKPSKGIR